MSDPDGQLSGIPPIEFRLKQSSTAREFADLLPDTSQYFEVWLEDLKPKLEPKTSHPQSGQPVDEQPRPGVFRFEGILRVDGYASGSLRSLTGCDRVFLLQSERPFYPLAIASGSVTR